ncbi:MAG: hypothetical protein HON98_00985, partial [Chloroflexi bacterium]|nr:hypothetical protein [Chloroflexota bacterium]
MTSSVTLYLDQVWGGRSEVQTRTLIAVIEDENLLNQAIAEAERVVGGFDRPNSGLLFVLPVARS